ncbi:MAG: hypothetical protein P1U37_07805 [Minwuia sp.]|nr:hypothetical protein [Minwuia sp.]
MNELPAISEATLRFAKTARRFSASHLPRISGVSTQHSRIVSPPTSTVSPSITRKSEAVAGWHSNKAAAIRSLFKEAFTDYRIHEMHMGIAAELSTRNDHALRCSWNCRAARKPELEDPLEARDGR